MRRRTISSLTAAALLVACAGSDPQGTPDGGTTPADASNGSPDAATDDAGTTADAGTPDAGVEPSPVAVFQLRELDLEVFGTPAVGNVIVVRDPATFPASGCVRFTTGSPAPSLASVGMPTMSGLAVQAFTCGDTNPRDGAGVACLGNPAGPPPIAGSTLDTGPWLTATDPELGVTGGSALGVATSVVAPPTDSAEILEPQTLPASSPPDMTVRWSALGHTDVVIEVELMLAGATALVVCAPDEDGRIVVPATLLDGDLLRLTVGNYTEVLARDAMNRTLAVQVMRGAALSP